MADKGRGVKKNRHKWTFKNLLQPKSAEIHIINEILPNSSYSINAEQSERLKIKVTERLTESSSPTPHHSTESVT